MPLFLIFLKTYSIQINGVFFTYSAVKVEFIFSITFQMF